MDPFPLSTFELLLGVDLLFVAFCFWLVFQRAIVMELEYFARILCSVICIVLTLMLMLNTVNGSITDMASTTTILSSGLSAFLFVLALIMVVYLVAQIALLLMERLGVINFG
jgi:hypothetical protein